MSDYVYLQGAGDVERAGNQMSRAAEEMQQAARNIEGSLERHQRFMDDWLDRFSLTIESLAQGIRLNAAAGKEEDVKP